jgi:hypothetical protein
MRRKIHEDPACIVECGDDGEIIITSKTAKLGMTVYPTAGNFTVVLPDGVGIKQDSTFPEQFSIDIL